MSRRRSKNFQPQGEPWQKPVERKPHRSAEEIIRRAWARQHADTSAFIYETNLSRPDQNKKMIERLVRGVKRQSAYQPGDSTDEWGSSATTNQLPHRLHGYESEYARQKRERAQRQLKQPDVLELLALENSDDSFQRHQPDPGETDRGSYQYRLDELRGKDKKAHSIHLDEGWY